MFLSPSRSLPSLPPASLPEMTHEITLPPFLNGTPSQDLISPSPSAEGISLGPLTPVSPIIIVDEPAEMWKDEGTSAEAPIEAQIGGVELTEAMESGISVSIDSKDAGGDEKRSSNDWQILDIGIMDADIRESSFSSPISGTRSRSSSGSIFLSAQSVPHGESLPSPSMSAPPSWSKIASSPVRPRKSLCRTLLTLLSNTEKADPSNDTRSRSPAFVMALSPTMHSNGSIARQTMFIEDDEMRYLSEVAFST
ncbi:uncharacterized protein EI90DRAFT_2144972 [Cantharellus anzutake]|uniref:uncharacterized protein n=1 Tax=Cantharellus anzutake TaxID=1750568 RepID=UPI0019059A25|nr:uncharacterized protein EI90DRAFT_2144972 [Cantharellus anzutake]KAF8325471.1 hypothetical protein EI90DRAFT_2144972 [Cantharellus anzutake]